MQCSFTCTRRERINWTLILLQEVLSIKMNGGDSILVVYKICMKCPVQWKHLLLPVVPPTLTGLKFHQCAPPMTTMFLHLWNVTLGPKVTTPPLELMKVVCLPSIFLGGEATAKKKVWKMTHACKIDTEIVYVDYSHYNSRILKRHSVLVPYMSVVYSCPGWRMVQHTLGKVTGLFGHFLWLYLEKYTTLVNL